VPLFKGNKGTLSNSYVWLTAYQEDGFDDGGEELISGFFKGRGSKNVINVDVCREGFDFPILVKNSLVYFACDCLDQLGAWTVIPLEKVNEIFVFFN
jgi:hypothetical protein